MAVTTNFTNKPLNPRGNDQSPKGYNRAELYSGKVLDFDGTNDKVNITTSSFDLYAISFYFKGAIGTGANGTAFSSGTTNVNDGVTLGAFTSTLTNETIAIGKDGNYTATSETFADGVHFICASWDATNSKYKLYVNGQEVDTFNNGSDAALNTGITAPALGYRKLLYDQYMDGGLSNVRAFSTALTAAQVADLYNNPEKIVPTGVADSALKLWLPMQEGAGTTAYDGSGNGNHGTISGATWTHGIGAPVAQTAVIDWNKGTNYVKQSEDFDNSDWQSLISGVGASLSVTDDYAEAPDGNQTASRIQAVHNGGPGDSYAILSTTASTSTSGSYTSAVWIKSNTGSAQTIAFYTRGSATNTLDITTEWVRYDIEGSGSSNYFNFGARSSTGTTQNCDFLVWGASINYGTELDSYVPTYGSGQESDVLLPQGLTTGRDITGVNLFENVRKQGALNLDGNSWAEVHDNASLDMTTGVSVECWVNVTEGSANKMFISKWSPYADDQRSYLLYLTDGEYLRFSISSDGQNSHTVSSSQRHFGGWKHFVATYDKTTLRLYVNGAAENTAAQTADINVGTFQVEIGRHQGDTSAISPDAIAQPRIYNLKPVQLFPCSMPRRFRC